MKARTDGPLNPFVLSGTSPPDKKIFENRVELLNKNQLAQNLKVSVSLINKLMKNGLPYLKLGSAVRFRIGDVVAFLVEKERP